MRLRNALPRVELTADFIVGFPGESEEDFRQTVAFAEQAEFLQMHVFAYSRRKGTPAANMAGQLDKATKKHRSSVLIERGNEIRQRRLERALTDPHCTVLFESEEDGFIVGHTDNFLEVAVKSDLPLHNRFAKVRLCAIDHGRLIAELEKNDES